MASSGGWYWRGPPCWRCRCGVTTRHAPRVPPQARAESVQLRRREAVLAKQFEQTPVTHQVQRAHDHQAVALAVQELLDLRQPALVAGCHQRAIQRREGAVFAREEAGERGGVAAAPGAEHRLHLALRLLQLTQRLVQQPQLVLARQRLEASELFGQTLQARGRLAVSLRAVHELLLDA